MSNLTEQAQPMDNVTQCSGSGSSGPSRQASGACNAEYKAAIVTKYTCDIQMLAINIVCVCHPTY